VLSPVLMYAVPEGPAKAVPVDNRSAPVVEAGAERIVILPLTESVASPLVMLTSPPAFPNPVDAPPTRLRAPPAPPLPACTRAPPAEPSGACPDATRTSAESASDEKPEVTVTIPDPFLASPDCRWSIPDAALGPALDSIVTRPPVALADAPERRLTSPPTASGESARLSPPRMSTPPPLDAPFGVSANP